MSEMTISLSNIQEVKSVPIKGVDGKVLGVLNARKLGSGEDLDLSQKLRRLNKVIDELTSIDFSGLDATKEEDQKQIEKLSKRASKLSDELSEIKEFEFNTYKKLLSDDQDGKVVDVVMNTLTEAERGKLFMQIFGDRMEIAEGEDGGS